MENFIQLITENTLQLHYIQVVSMIFLRMKFYQDDSYFLFWVLHTVLFNKNRYGGPDLVVMYFALEVITCDNKKCAC